jgi:hypothetical protein
VKRTGVVAALVIGLGCSGNGDAPGSSGQAGVNGAAGTSVAGTSPSAGTSGSAGTGAAGTTAAGGTTGAASTGAAGTGAAGTGAAGTGAAGTTAPSDGGAGTAGGSDGGVASASCEGRLVCEDFEKATLGGKPPAPFIVRAGKGTVAVDATRAASGKQSVKVAITATATGDTYRQAMLAVTGAPLIPPPNNHVYGRFLIYTDRIPDKSVHWTIAHGDGPVGTTGTTGTYNYGGMGGLMANYYRNTAPDPTDCWQTKSSAFPTGRWVCVGFEYDGGGTEMRFSLDGAEVPELHVVGLTKTDATCTVKGVDGRWLAPMFKNISVGWESYQHDVAGAHDAWIDDVVLDDQPVGCP